MKGSKMKKRYIIFPLAAALLLAGCGRLTGDYMNSPKNQKAALKALNEQFGISFSYAGKWDFPVGSGGVFGKHTGVAAHFYAKCDELPNENIAVVYADDGHAASNYIAKLYEKDTTDLLGQIMGAVYDGTYRVCLEKDYVTADFDGDTTFEKYLSSGNVYTVSFCTTDSADLENKYKQLNDLLIANGINCQPYVYSYTEDVFSHGEEDIFKLNNPAVIGVSRNPEHGSMTLEEDFVNEFEFYEY